MESTGSQLNICIVRWNISYRVQPGTTTIALSLAREWLAQGHRVFLVSPATSVPLPLGIEFHPTKTANPADLYKVAADLIREQDMDCLLSFEPFYEGPIAAQLKYQFPSIHRIHFGMHIVRGSGQEQLSEKMTFSNPDCLVFQCQWFYKFYMARKGISRLSYVPTHIIPMGVDSNRFRPTNQKASIRSALKLPYDPLLIFVGRLSQENCPPGEWDKGAHYLISALPTLLAKYPNLGLAILGTGPQKNQLLTQMARLGIEGSVAIHQAATPEAAVPYLQAANMFVLPSVCDVMPVAILEAMAVGLPVVSTNVGGIPEAVSPTEGILVKPKDPNRLATAILEILDNPPLAYQFSRSARLRAVREFSWKQVSLKLISIFQQL